jgi:hypothetical protein
VRAILSNNVEAVTANLDNIAPKTGNAISIISLPTYADNASAVAGGLALDRIYKTATGELRIVV